MKEIIKHLKLDSSKEIIIMSAIKQREIDNWEILRRIEQWVNEEITKGELLEILENQYNK
jgi:hypothetical protein